MALATVNQRVWNATAKTDANFMDFLNTIMTVDLGFTLFDSDAGTAGFSFSPALSRVYSLQFNASAKGTVYFRLGVGGVSFPGSTHTRIYDSWDGTNNTGANASVLNSGGLTQVSYTDTQSYLFTIYNHPEVKMVNVASGSNDMRTFGIVRPFTKPTYWSDDAGLYAFLYYSHHSSELEFSSCNNPYIGAVEVNLFPSIGNAGDVFSHNPNPYTSRYPVVSAPYIFSDESASTNQRGNVGQFSNDIIIGNSPGLNTIVQINGQTTRYQFCTNRRGSNDASLGVKIVN